MNQKTDYKVSHVLKSHPAPFAAVWAGEKMHETRYNDRGYKVGMALRLSEWNPDRKEFTGRDVDVIIIYIRHAPAAPAVDPYGLQPGFCVFDFLILNHFKNGEIAKGSRVGEAPAMSPPPFSTMANPEE